MIFGTQYYRAPFPRREFWEKDLDNILAIGMNTVKLWSVWSWTEREPGKFYFDDLDELIDLCGRRGLQVVVNLVPEGAPYWLGRAHPDARYTAQDGNALDFSGASNLPSGGWPGLCRDKPEVEDLSNRFLTTVAARYKEVAHLIAFDVWNEPHLDPAFDYPEKIFCYCNHSLHKFNRWLLKRYGNLGALNTKWNRAYSNWDDVGPPIRFGTYPDMIDWRLFWLENHAGWLESRVRAVKRVAPAKTAVTHVPFSGYLGQEGKGGLGLTLSDEFLLAPKVEKFGLTSFPKWLMGNDFAQHAMNVELVAAASGEKEFWQSELQSGGGLWGVYGNSVATAEEVRLWNWSSLAAGVKGIMYWQWRPEPSGLEAPGFGLTTIDGEFSERTTAAGEVATQVLAGGLLTEARRLLPINGIYVSRHSDLLAFAASRSEALYARGLYGAYLAFFTRSIPVRFVHADNLSRAHSEGLRTLYVPVALSVSAEEEQELAHFVGEGGTLIAEACIGLFDDRGLLRSSLLLDQVIGVKPCAVDRVDQVDLVWKAGEPESVARHFVGLQYRQDVEIMRKDVEVVGTFPDGKPAVCQRRHGKGLGIWIGTFCSLAVQAGGLCPSGAAVTRWALPGGYPEIEAIDTTTGVFVRAHRTADDALILVAVNYAESEADLRVMYSDPEGVARERQKQSTLELKIQLKPRDGQIIRLPTVARGDNSPQ
jgi:beta-galactosidase GanA